ncbi:MAG: hypothetical protein WBU92_11035 [Candidatus Dormiibacterota bacterium]
MRRLLAWDVIATLAVAAIAVPYMSYLANGNAPLVQDPRGMVGVGLFLGAVAFLAAWTATGGAGLRLYQSALAVLTAGVGGAALILSEGAAAEQWLAAFLGAIAVTWAVIMLDHATQLSTGMRRQAAHS